MNFFPMIVWWGTLYMEITLQVTPDLILNSPFDSEVNNQLKRYNLV